MSDRASLGDNFMSDLVAHIDRVLSEAGMDEAAIEKARSDIEQRVRDAFGGQIIYVGKARFLVAQKHAELVAAFDGKNVCELAERFGMSVPQVYRVLHADKLRRRQQPKG